MNMKDKYNKVPRIRSPSGDTLGNLTVVLSELQVRE
jgi:hypothetical protein